MYYVCAEGEELKGKRFIISKEHIEGKGYNFWRRGKGDEDTVFGPKYRPLVMFCRPPKDHIFWRSFFLRVFYVFMYS